MPISKKNNMRIISKLILFCALITFISCEDFLEVKEVGKTSIPIYFSDMDGIRSAIPGAYSSVYEYYDSEFFLYPQVAGDLLKLDAVGEGIKMFEQYNYSSAPEQEASAVGHIWSKTFLALANVNNILQYQPDLLLKYPDNELELEKIKAQALFLRALIHFDLVRTYAQNYNYTEDASHIGVPILTKSPGANDNVARNTVKETYTQILEDLHNAEEIFTEDNVELFPYFASKLSVQALLSRVYLYMGKWGNSEKYSKYVLDQINLTPRDEYVDMFRTLQPGREALFVLSGEKKNSNVESFFATAGPVAFASDKLMNMFSDSLDVRLELFQDIDGGGNASTLKYYRPNIDQTSYGSDLYVIRGSEVVLNLAEALAQQNSLEAAKDELKKIKGRALGIEPEIIIIETNNQKELLNRIAEERAKELSFEGHRFFDLTRKKENLVRDPQTTSNVQRIDYPSNRFILPIPLSEMNTNENMVQNDGY